MKDVLSKWVELIFSSLSAISDFKGSANLYKVAFLILIFISCASRGELKEINPGNTVVKLRYVNLNLIIEYIINNDPGARDTKKRKEDMLLKIETISAQLSALKDDTNKNDLIEKEKFYKQELAKLKKDEENYKADILLRIDRVLENIAKKSDVDFVFNIGEGVLYAKREYDITEEVLREIIKEKERSAPVSR